MSAVLSQSIQPMRARVSDRLAASLIKLTAAVPCPPTQPGIKMVMTNALTALRAAIVALPTVGDAVVPFCKDIETVCNDFAGLDLVGAQHQMLGLHVQYPAWSLLACTPLADNRDLQVAIGLSLCTALMLGKPISKKTANEIRSLQSKLADGVISQTLLNAAAEKLKQRQVTKTINLVKLQSSASDRSIFSLNAVVIATIQASLSSLRTVERQAAGRDNELSIQDLRTAAAQLLVRVDHGDGDALALCIAYCIGLPWDISVQVPFARGPGHDSMVAWVDPVAGFVYVNLTHALGDLSTAATAQHVNSTLLLRRPLPILLANSLYEAYVSNGGLQRLSALTIQAVSNRAKLKLPEVHHSASVARFIASRGTAALNATERRDLAAFATLSFQLVSKSDLHYITPSEQDIWSACDKHYQHVGFGEAVPTTGYAPTHVGSRVTPSSAWIQSIFDEAANDLESKKAGKKYTLKSVVSHHNAYARYVGLFFQLVVGGRNRKKINFSAQAWHPSAAFGLIADKPLGPTRGVTPIPISTLLRRQIRLWHAHVQALKRRFDRLDRSMHQKAIDYLQQVLDGEQVPMLFLLGTNGAIKLLTADHLFQGAASGLNHDFGRHFIGDHATQLGLPFEDIQDWLRHHTNGVSHHESTSEHVIYVYLTRTARAIDDVLVNTDIKALSGLSKEGA